MMNYDSFLLPEVARALPDASLERSLSLLALRNLWHIIFDLIPKTMSFIPDDMMLLEDFLTFADRKKLSMNWALHMHLLDWLHANENFAKDLDIFCVQELMVAAGVRWTIDIISDPFAQGILLASPYLTGAAIGAWRSNCIQHSMRVVKFKMPNQQLPSVASYAISLKYDEWSEIQWQVLPG